MNLLGLLLRLQKSIVSSQEEPTVEVRRMPCHFLALCLLQVLFPSLKLNFLICKMGIMVTLK